MSIGNGVYCREYDSKEAILKIQKSSLYSKDIKSVINFWDLCSAQASVAGTTTTDQMV